MEGVSQNGGESPSNTLRQSIGLLWAYFENRFRSRAQRLSAGFGAFFALHSHACMVCAHTCASEPDVYFSIDHIYDAHDPMRFGEGPRASPEQTRAATLRQHESP